MSMPLSTPWLLLPEHQLTPEQQRAYQALAQHDLRRLYAGEGGGGSGSGGASLDTFDQKANATIDPKVAQGIATQLKALPREAVDRFLEKFGVQRIKDLPAAQVEKARAFVEQLQTELTAPLATNDETPEDISSRASVNHWVTLVCVELRGLPKWSRSQTLFVREFADSHTRIALSGEQRMVAVTRA